MAIDEATQTIGVHSFRGSKEFNSTQFPAHLAHLQKNNFKTPLGHDANF